MSGSKMGAQMVSRVHEPWTRSSFTASVAASGFSMRSVRSWRLKTSVGRRLSARPQVTNWRPTLRDHRSRSRLKNPSWASTRDRSSSEKSCLRSADRCSRTLSEGVQSIFGRAVSAFRASTNLPPVPAT